MEKIFININEELIAVLVFLVAFTTTYLLIPKLISIIVYKNLMDNPNERSSHSIKTPSLGGIAFYFSLIFGIFIIYYFDYDELGFHLIAGLTILLFIGLKDDLMILSAQTKIWAQLFAISFILIIPDLWLTSFDGFLGINDIPDYIGLLLSCFIMISIINAYNLIDGIDGIAGMLGVLISTIFSLFFYFSQNYFYFFISLIIVGFLIAFLRFNLSNDKRIFMGDTGSLIVGFLIAVLNMFFLTLNEYEYEMILINPSQKFLISISILFFPIIDVIRVVVMRLMNKRLPFEADRRHMHHILVDKGLNHKRASITMTMSGLFIFVIIYGLNLQFGVSGLIFVFLLFTFISFNILLLLDSDSKAISSRKKVKSLFPKKIRVIEFRLRKKIIIVFKKLFYKDLL